MSKRLLCYLAIHEHFRRAEEVEIGGGWCGKDCDNHHRDIWKLMLITYECIACGYRWTVKRARRRDQP